MSVLPRGIFYLCVLILLCFNSTAIFSCRIPPAGAEGRWLGHLWVRKGRVGGGRFRGGWTGDITLWSLSCQHQVPEALGAKYWSVRGPGGGERRLRRCCRSVSSPAAPVRSHQREVLLPCGPSICPSASSRGAYFLRAVTAASDVLSRS